MLQKITLSWKSVLLSVFLLAAVGFGIVYVQRPHDIRNRAAVNGSVLSMNPSYAMGKASGSTFTVGILLNAGPDSVTAADIKMNYDPALLEIVTFDVGQPLPVVLTPTKIENGVISVTLGAQPNTNLKGSNVIGTLTVKTKTNNDTSITFANASQVAALEKSANTLVSTSGINITSRIDARTPTPTRRPTTSITRTPTPTRRPTTSITRTPTPTRRPTTSITRTPTPTPRDGQTQTMEFRVKLAGVDAGQAAGAKVNVKFQLKNGSIKQLSAPLTLAYEGSGIYKTSAVVTNLFPSGTEFRVSIKGEKHVGVKFCNESGQSGPCADSDYITYPGSSQSVFTLDLTGIPLPPGDLNAQDAKADMADLAKLKPLMAKVCSSLTETEKLTGDVNYDGCVTVRDVFLMLQTLETRFDE